MNLNTPKVEQPENCCATSPYVPTTFEQELEQSIKHSIKRTCKVQEALEFVKNNAQVFSRAKELGINCYLE